MTYYFVGSQSAIEGVGLLNRFGQRVELDEELATVLREKVAILTQAEFDSTGLTLRECNAWPNTGNHDSAPQEFRAKCSKARLLLHEIRYGNTVADVPVVAEEPQPVDEAAPPFDTE
jgi:hypothetical protein